jgi:hypothetical protein
MYEHAVQWMIDNVHGIDLEFECLTFHGYTCKTAIIRFTGYLLNDRPIRVESIIDYKYRVRVPEQLVYYTVGEVKKTRDGSKNTMRMVQNSRDHVKETRPKQKTKMKKHSRNGGKTHLDCERSQGKRKRISNGGRDHSVNKF